MKYLSHYFDVDVRYRQHAFCLFRQVDLLTLLHGVSNTVLNNKQIEDRFRFSAKLLKTDRIIITAAKKVV